MTARKVLVIGWDAADWKVINALIEQGKMPHTARLIERGTMGNLATLHPVLSPMLWTSIATGKRPFKHGILGFSEPTPDGGGVQPVSQLSRTTKAIWNILNQQGLKSTVVGWWPSHPVEPINGCMVSNHYHHAVGPLDQPWPLAPGMVHPERLAETLADLRFNPNELIPEQVLPFVPLAREIDQDKDRRLGSVMKILAECASINSAATWLMENEPWDFFGVYYDAIDHFSHGFMKYHPPRRDFIPERDYELYKGVVEAGYRFHDLMLGNMLKLAGDDVTVIICSDHGFHPDHLRPKQIPKEPAGPAIEHRDYGMFLIAGPGIKQDHLIHGATLLDITPTILTLYGLPVGEDMDGKPLLTAFEQPPTVSRIPSWDAVAGDDGRHSHELRTDPLAAKEALDQLVALGYIEKPDGNQEKAVARTARELRYNLAQSYMDAGRYRDAVPLLRELLENDPDEYRFGVQLALCYRSLSETAQLRQLVEQLTEQRQQAAVTARTALKEWAEKINARSAERQQNAADGNAVDDTALLDEKERQEFDRQRLLARFSTFDLDYLMGCVLIDEGHYQEALHRLRRAETADAQRPGLFLQIGEAYLRLHRWADAEQAYNKALNLDPLNAHAHLGVARSLLPRRDSQRAATEALETVRLVYHYPFAHYCLGLALLRLREFDRAEEALRVAISLNPNFARAHRVLARLYTRSRRDPERALYHRGRARVLRRQQQALPIDMSAVLDEPTPQVTTTATEPTVVSAPAAGSEFITVVAGLPRSGTSMMMQMLAAGGLPILTDGKRVADADNPKGYYELEAATRLRQDRTWLTEAVGKGVKIVAQLLPFLTPEHQYRIVFMEREFDEVLASQKTMLERLERQQAKLTPTQLKQAYRTQLQHVKVWLMRQPNIHVLYVSHRDALSDPQTTAARVNGFLGETLDTAAMTTVVDRSLHRQRAGTLPTAV